MQYINSITEAIGHTPLLKLNRIGKDVGANVFVKLEYLNPSGSYKDRMALSMVEAAERGDTWNGKKLSEGGTVVEASAGNTAPAVAMVCASKGYKTKLFLYRYQMENPNNARMLITKAYGPEVAVSSAPETYLTKEQIEEFSKIEPDLVHVLSAKLDCQKCEDSEENCVWVDQIYNKYNYLGQLQMGREIYEQLDGKVDAVGCSVSSGASLLGMCLGLKECGVIPELTFGVVPKGSETYYELQKDVCNRDEFKVGDLSSEIAKTIGLEKWYTEPSVNQIMYEQGYPAKFYRVTAEEARDMANRLCQEEGIFCGMSSGANVAVALKIAQELGPGKNVVTTIVDRRDRYLSETPNERYVV